MCDDGGHAHAAATGVSRRGLLQGMVALAALAACSPDAGGGRRAAVAPSPLPSRAPNPAGLSAYVLGMHLHASTSEGVGSVRSHLAQAAANGFDVAWFTEHDWRRRRLLYRRSYSFTPDEEQFGGTWTLESVPSEGSPDDGSGTSFRSDPVTPNDPRTPRGSLRVRVAGSGADPATVGRRVRTEGTSRANFRSRIAGRLVSVDVLPAAGGPDASGEVLFGLSHHPAAHGRPDAVHAIVYRLRPDLRTRAVRAEGTTAVVDVPVTPGRWQTIGFDLVADVGRAWPDLDPRDNTLSEIVFRATSRNRATAEVFFGFLRFDERAGYDAVGVERDLVGRYAEEVPGVLGLIGTEISLGPHMNQFGGPQDPFDYGPVPSLRQTPGDIRRSITEFVHAQGGLACINHPFKPADLSIETTAQAIARDLLAIGAGGADLIEVGYGRKGGAGLLDHLAVWDTLSRNGLFLTGNGVSDDHSGQDWAGQTNRYYTGAWSSALDEPTLLDALGRGRVYVGYLGSFGGTVDMAVDATVPMGAVSVSPLPKRTLRIDVAGLPKGGAVQVLRGAVDYAGMADPNPDTSVVATLGATDLQRSREVPIDTSHDCFHRLQVTDAAGGVVAFGQPIWVLKTPPPTGIPPRRRAAG
jgi:hypothetical protein